VSKFIKTKTACHLAVLAVLAAPLTSAMATNGMLMEGYGPISTGMGGASQAIDHGNEAMAQNPATLGMMPDGTSRVDVALGILGPDVKSSVPAYGMTAESGGNSYIMPAFGYSKRSGALTYGVGMFAQGGMGTEYTADSFMSAGTGEPSRSELGVGNVIFPVAYQVNPNLTVGAALKFLWASLDMRMAGTVGTLSPIVTGGSGMLYGGMLQAAQAGMNDVRARVDFSGNSDFTGAAKSTGFGASLGATYKVNKDVTLGASYQFKSALDDMKTSASAASMSMYMPDGTMVDSGKITVIDFQMPSTLAVGGSWQINPSLMLAADLKYIGWSDVMKDFRLQYDSANGAGSVSFQLPQDWSDQTVLNLGLAFKANDKLTLRAGLNLADNPVPDAWVHPLFPATVENHVTFGFGYKVSAAGEFNMAVTLAPKVTVTNPNMGVEISHSQTNWQFMYSHTF
jgi:long-chain fatty acid transport protein